jgi:hypothetical protein
METSCNDIRIDMCVVGIKCKNKMQHFVPMVGVEIQGVET